MIIKLYIQAIKYLCVCVCDRLNTNNSPYFKNKIEITKIHNLHFFFLFFVSTKQKNIRCDICTSTALGRLVTNGHFELSLKEILIEFTICTTLYQFFPKKDFVVKEDRLFC